MQLSQHLRCRQEDSELLSNAWGLTLPRSAALAPDQGTREPQCDFFALMQIFLHNQTLGCELLKVASA